MVFEQSIGIQMMFGRTVLGSQASRSSNVHLVSIGKEVVYQRITGVGRHKVLNLKVKGAGPGLTFRQEGKRRKGGSKR